MRLFTMMILAANAAAAVVPAPSCARPNDAKPVRLPAQSVRISLQALARIYGVELLFSDDLLGTRSARSISATLTVDQALKAVLSGSGLIVRRSHTGGYIIVTAPPERPEATAETAAPEIVVIGRRTQNADIRRFTNDVQPYQVLQRKDVRNAHAATAEELISKRMSADATGLSLSQRPVSGQGSPQSVVDLRGLGSDETLVLIDGRRMPRLPTSLLGFIQSDLNALSPESIERVEVVTSTAGGVYGPGALAGVVNLVLRRDYRGADVTVTGGMTERGDAPYARLDARLGFTPDHGGTEVMLSYSRASSGNLRVKDRPFSQDASALELANNAGHYRYGDLPQSDSVNVSSSAGGLLTLKPAFGGGDLDSSVTTLPPGDGRSMAQIGALLRAHAGTVDTVPSNSIEGGLGDILIARETSSILANVRHAFAGGFEIYADVIRLLDKGITTTQASATTLQLSAADARNPFQQPIDLSFPANAFSSTIRQRLETQRESLGLVASLPAEWRGNLDLSFGRTSHPIRVEGNAIDLPGLIALFYGLPGATPIDPFSGSATFQAALASHGAPFLRTVKQSSTFSDFSLRLAGPVLALPGGALFATLLAEQQRDSVASATTKALAFGLSSSTSYRAYGERLRSGYMELRAPLFADNARFAPLRGLELQLAARYDSTRSNVAPDPADDPRIVYARYVSGERAALLYTAGFKVKPLPGLLLRGSLATGELSPPLQQIADIQLFGLDFADPKRGNRKLGSERPYKLIVFKDKLIPERAQTLSVGFIATPFGRRGPTIGLDYSRIRLSNEAAGKGGQVFTFIANEDLYPGRVTRAPLTAADAAKGYTGGVVTQIDSSYTTFGWTRIVAIDVHMGIPFETRRSGAITLRLAGTWQPSYHRYVDPAFAPEDLVNTVDGALALRGNATLDWTKGTTGLSLTAQYYGAYRIDAGAVTGQLTNPLYRTLQGSDRIAASVTFDLAGEYRFRLPNSGSRERAFEVRFGIQDLLDRSPAIVVRAERGYSYYADPRGRRFELTLATRI